MSNQQMSCEELYNAPIAIDDVAGMYRRKVQRNDRPYIAETTKLNNRTVDDWKKNVLQKICDGEGKVPANRVEKSFRLYEEGKNIEQYMEMKKKGMVPVYSDEVIEFWKDFFENLTVGELHAHGSGVVATGWLLIQEYTKVWFAEQKWERLFSKSRDPLWWEENYHSHTDYLDGKIHPLWTNEKMDDIFQKVAAVLANEIKMSIATGFR